MHVIIHIIGGFLVASIFTTFFQIPFINETYFICGVFAAFPDIDIFIGRPILRGAAYRSRGIQHRCGLTHSIFTYLTPLSFLIVNPLWSVMISLSIFSHWLLDSFNYIGVRLAAFRGIRHFLIKHECDFRITKSNAWSFTPNLIALVTMVTFMSLFTNFLLMLFYNIEIMVIFFSTISIVAFVSWYFVGRDYNPRERATVVTF